MLFLIISLPILLNAILQKKTISFEVFLFHFSKKDMLFFVTFALWQRTNITWSGTADR